MPNPTCALPDCEKPARSNSGTALCKMHYHRQYRHGSTDVTASGVHTGPGRLYRRISRPQHPLADDTGRGWEHRFVLYDAIGPGTHPCHHCGTPVQWGGKNRATWLEVDHLNHRGDDNRPENLVPSCRPCNTRRGASRRHQALTEAGWWSGQDTIDRLTTGRRKPPLA